MSNKATCSCREKKLFLPTGCKSALVAKFTKKYLLQQRPAAQNNFLPYAGHLHAGHRADGLRRKFVI